MRVERKGEHRVVEHGQCSFYRAWGGCVDRRWTYAGFGLRGKVHSHYELGTQSISGVGRSYGTP